MSEDGLIRGPVTATEGERETLTRLDALLERDPLSDLQVSGADGKTMTLPASAVELFHTLVHHLARGRVVTVVQYDRQLTTQQAADLLNVSRPYLIQLLDHGEIPHTKTGTHRRVEFEALMAYKKRRDAARREALRELTQMSEEMGLYDIDDSPVYDKHAAQR